MWGILHCGFYLHFPGDEWCWGMLWLGPPLWVSWQEGLTPTWLAVWPEVHACCGPTGGCCYYAYVLSRVWLFVTPCTVARQAPLSMGLSRQECWNGFCHACLQGIFLTQGSNLHLQHCRRFFTVWATREVHSLPKGTLTASLRKSYFPRGRFSLSN